MLASDRAREFVTFPIELIQTIILGLQNTSAQFGRVQFSISLYKNCLLIKIYMFYNSSTSHRVCGRHA